MNTDFEKQIENLPKKGNSIKDKLFNKDYFIRSTEFGVSTTEKEEIIFESKKSSIGNFVLAGTAAIGVSFRFKESIITYSAIIIIIIVMTLGYFFTLKRKSKQIKIDKIGFEIENIKYDWDDIYDFGALVKPSRHITYYELIVFSKAKGKKTYSLFSFQSDKDEILKNMNYFNKKFETNKSIS